MPTTHRLSNPDLTPGWGDKISSKITGKEMATYSYILGWRIPWTEEPGRLQSIGLQRVGHNWSDLAHMQSKINELDRARTKRM